METTKIEETTVKTLNPSTVLPDCQIYQDLTFVCQRTYSAPNTPEQRALAGQEAESSLQKYSLQTRLCAREPMNTCTNNKGPECCVAKPAKVKSADNSDSEHEYRAESDENKNSKTNETIQTPQDLMLERKPKEPQRANRAPCCKVQLRVIYMNQDTKQPITQPERNNNFNKIMLDTSECKSVMVAETE